MKTNRCNCLLIIAAALVLCGASLRADTVSSAPVSENQQIQFEQDKALANMNELENRMFRLAETIREAQPEDSARLLMGLRAAREHLISERMRAVSKLLEGLNLNQAAEEQALIIEKLEELKQLLLTADLDLEIKLEQLRKLNAALEQLNQLIQSESRQADQAKALAESEATPGGEQLDSLTQQEKRNQRSGAELQQTAKQISPDAIRAARALGNASSRMESAGEKLGGGRPGDASRDQQLAVAELKKARQDLEELRDRLRKEVEGLAKQRVMDNLSEMIARQIQVRESTESLAARLEENRGPVIQAIKRLSASEEQIAALAAQSIELIELTQFSVVLPRALHAAREWMIDVGQSLSQGIATAGVIEQERRIEESLEALLEAMKDSARFADASSSGQCQACNGDRNKLLAEVKMLRWMQFSVNQETRQLDRLIQSKNVEADKRVAEAQEMQKRQADLRAITTELHDLTCSDCLSGLH